MAIFLPTGRKIQYTRLTIPRGLRRYFRGRREVWRSLRTSDRRLGKAQSDRWLAQGRQLFVTLERRGKYMSPYEIEDLVARWLENRLEFAEDCRALMGPMSDDCREANLGCLDMTREETFE